MGGFLSGILNTVGPALREKNQADFQLKQQAKVGEMNTLWSSMQTSAERLDELKKKDKLSPEEEAEAKDLAAQYAYSDEQYKKLTKSNKPVAQAYEKVSGIIKQRLTKPSPKGQLQGPQQGQPAQAQGQYSTADATGANPEAAGGAGAPQGGTQLASPQTPAPKPAAQGSMQGAMAQGSPEYARQLDQRRVMERRAKLADEGHMTGAARSYFMETGKPLAGNKPIVVKGVKREGHQGTWTKVGEGEDAEWIEQAPPTAKPHNYQKEWAVYPDGTQHAIRVDPQDPKNRMDADTGEPVPEGAKIENIPVDLSAFVFHWQIIIANGSLLIASSRWTARGLLHSPLDELPQFLDG